MSDSSSGESQVAFDTPTPEEIEKRNGLLAGLSREMVRIYKEQFGRGPTKSRTNFAGPDCVVCTLEETLTPAERTMVAMGEHQRLRDMRLFFQHASEAEFCEAVERLTGRKVRAFISGIDTTQDVAAEIFYLETSTDGHKEAPIPRKAR